MMQRYAVVLAGGVGKRLWPFSRTHLPKQFIPFHDTTLLEQTVSRVRRCVAQEHCFVMTNSAYRTEVMRHVGSMIADCICETRSENTAPAMIRAWYTLSNRVRDEGVVLYVPSDHYITDFHAYTVAINAAYALAEKLQCIVLIGIPQTYIATTFGCVRLGDVILEGDDGASAYYVDSFHEKPTREIAEVYFTRPDIVWNAGIVCAPLSVLHTIFETYLPDMVQGIAAEKPVIPCSFDCAVLERLPPRSCALIKGNFVWSDVGTIPTFIAASPGRSDAVVAVRGATRNTVHAVKKVVLVGVSDLYVIETDDMFVVMRSHDVERIDLIMAELSNRGLEECM